MFIYRARNQKGEIIEGSLDVSSEKIAFETLEKEGLIIVFLKKKIETKFFEKFLIFFKRVSLKDLIIFSRELATLVNAGVSVLRSLKILAHQTKNSYFKKVLFEIIKDVEGGTSLSISLSAYPHIFSDFYLSMIRLGETGGKLDEILNYLTDQLEKDNDFISQIKGAMIYPCFIVGGLIIVGVLLMIFVIPQLTEVLKELGQELPFSTKALIGFSDFLKNYIFILILILGSGFFGFRYFIKTSQGKNFWHPLKLKFPILGKLFQKIYLTRFSRSLSTLITGGLPIVESLYIISEAVGNRVYQNLILETIKEIEKGGSIVTAFSKSKVIPPMTSQMMKVGEETGALDKILSKIADFYTKETERGIKGLITLIEPILMVLIGIGVGVVIASILLPMYNLANSM